MAQVTVTLGAPSLAGKDCVELVTEAFEASEYPLAAEITNLMPRWESFPNCGGFNIGHVAAADKNVATVKFESFEDIKAFADRVGQVAFLNNFEKAVSIKAEGTEVEDVDEESDEVGKAKVGAAKVAAKQVKSTKKEEQ